VCLSVLPNERDCLSYEQPTDHCNRQFAFHVETSSEFMVLMIGCHCATGVELLTAARYQSDSHGLLR
jgi:hypothetical protein